MKSVKVCHTQNTAAMMSQSHKSMMHSCSVFIKWECKECIASKPLNKQYAVPMTWFAGFIKTFSVCASDRNFSSSLEVYENVRHNCFSLPLTC